MEQAVRAPSMAALFVEPCPAATLVHIWTVDANIRANIDWTRGTLMLLVDEFMEMSPVEMPKILGSVVTYIDRIMPHVDSAADRQQLLLARLLASSTSDNYASLSLDAISREVMEAARLLITGTDYHDMDEPEDLIRGRA